MLFAYCPNLIGWSPQQELGCFHAGGKVADDGLFPKPNNLDSGRVSVGHTAALYKSEMTMRLRQKSTGRPASEIKPSLLATFGGCVAFALMQCPETRAQNFLSRHSPRTHPLRNLLNRSVTGGCHSEWAGVAPPARYMSRGYESPNGAAARLAGTGDEPG